MIGRFDEFLILEFGSEVDVFLFFIVCERYDIFVECLKLRVIGLLEDMLLIWGYMMK